MGGGASPGEVLWTWQTSDIVLGICAVGATLIYLDFMLIPLTMAYFTTFMMLPVLEAFEKRPYGNLCIEKAPWTKMMPVVDEEATAANGNTIVDCANLSVMDNFAAKIWLALFAHEFKWSWPDTACVATAPKCVYPLSRPPVLFRGDLTWNAPSSWKANRGDPSGRQNACFSNNCPRWHGSL